MLWDEERVDHSLLSGLQSSRTLIPVLFQKLSNPQGGNISGYNLVKVSVQTHLL